MYFEIGDKVSYHPNFKKAIKANDWIGTVKRVDTMPNIGTNQLLTIQKNNGEQVKCISCNMVRVNDSSL